MKDVKAVEILLVEDDARDEELTLRGLQRNNLANRVRVVRDGEAALNFFFGSGDEPPEAVTPRLVLLDLKLPKVSGIEVLRRLKADVRTRVIPVVILTSSQEDRDVKECYRLGVNSYIIKPVEFDKFISAVSELGLYWLLLNEGPV